MPVPPPDSDPSRRRHVRRPVELHAKLRVSSGKEMDAFTENISPGGAFLRVVLPPSTKEIVASFDLPHGKELHVRAKVRWRRSEPPGVGISFETFLQGPAEPDLLKMLR